MIPVEKYKQEFVLSVLWLLRTEQDPIKKEERKAKLMKETIPFYLAKFEKIVSENNGFSVGTSVSIPRLLIVLIFKCIGTYLCKNLNNIYFCSWNLHNFYIFMSSGNIKILILENAWVFSFRE